MEGFFDILLHRPDVTFSGIGIYLFGTFTGILFYIKKKIVERRKVDGCWEYLVHEANNNFSHKGYCNIKTCNDRLRISGVRKYTCTLDQKCEEVNIAWNATWASVCSDNRLRFDYQITLTDGKFYGAICRVNLPNNKPTEMTGNYYLLPPFDPEVLNCKHGTIKFKKISNPSDVTPPTLSEINQYV